MNTVLFDLDGTLLPIDMEEFAKSYFIELSKKLSDQINPDLLPKYVWGSTEYMVSNLEKNKTNKDAFFEDFQKRIDTDLKGIMLSLDEFYKFDFKNLKRGFNPNPIVKDSVKLLKEKGYGLVIATNPIFPRDAILHRIEWAGLDKDDFQLITTYEDMHFCKPNLEYYEEILNIIDKNPKDVMMVGNDVQEDIVASKLGIKTFLIEDYKIDRKHPKYIPDYNGSLDDFLIFSKELPVLSK